MQHKLVILVRVL
ncbi:hypothetical protein MTR67_032551 [Solanum verrucosum]|uniref:Uncharacterized protein n=1 Tax=Solanum verrucosum TaxID=315347 RepID=A0AAF0ZFS3_SOLVR|nr:hypothetical protein MTR67_032551 [Solanum verrucosum]